MHKEQATSDTPPFHLNETDHQVLELTDDDFKPHTWTELKEIIKNNDLAILKRRPSDLLRYIEWTKRTNVMYGTVTNYICQKRLLWTPLPSGTPPTGPIFDCKSTTPFHNTDDYKILRNDWPYGLASCIAHLVIWLKNRIPTDPVTGDLTAHSRQLIEDFVQKTFVNKLLRTGLVDAPDHVLWFKNPTTLQTVRALDHIHVLVRDVPDTVLDEWYQ